MTMTETNLTLVPIRGNLLPMIDFTLFENNERFYDALGMALLIATGSPIQNRILGFDQTPIWIDTKDFHQAYLEKNIGPSSIETACAFLIQSMVHTDMSRFAVEQMTLVVFSDFSGSSISKLHLSLTNLFLTAGFSRAPVFLYWNVNVSGNVSSNIIEEGAEITGAGMVSGFSIPLLQHIGSLSPQDWITMTPFDFISQLIP